LMLFDAMRDRPGVPSRDLASISFQQGQVAFTVREDRRVVPPNVATGTRNPYLALRRFGQLAIAVDLVGGVTVRALHPCLEMQIRGEAVLLPSIDGWRLLALDDRRSEPSMVVLFKESNEIGSNVVGVVALEACGHARVLDERVVARLSIGTIGVRHVARGTTLPAVFAPSRRAGGVQVATETRPSQEIVSQIS
jgi:hypothetical protein